MSYLVPLAVSLAVSLTNSKPRADGRLRVSLAVSLAVPLAVSCAVSQPRPRTCAAADDLELERVQTNSNVCADERRTRFFSVVNCCCRFRTLLRRFRTRKRRGVPLGVAAVGFGLFYVGFGLVNGGGASPEIFRGGGVGVFGGRPRKGAGGFRCIRAGPEGGRQYKNPPPPFGGAPNTDTPSLKISGGAPAVCESETDVNVSDNRQQQPPGVPPPFVSPRPT